MCALISRDMQQLDIIRTEDRSISVREEKGCMRIGCLAAPGLAALLTKSREKLEGELRSLRIIKL